MRIDVGELMKARTGETRTYQIENWEIEMAEGAPRELVNGSTTLLRTQAGILASVNVALDTRDACSRCLREVKISLQIDFEEEYLPIVDIFTGAALSSPEDPGALRIDDRQVLDVSEAVRQYREMALPMQPLCRPDCPGICPACGRDLNLGACDCPQESVDDHWSALAELGRRLGDG
jgi:uncharacterized protein